MTRLVLNWEDSEIPIKALADQGLLFRESIDLDVPELPADISRFDDEDLMELFTRLTAYSNFLNTQLALASIAEHNAEEHMDTTRSLALLEANVTKTTKDTVTLLKARISSDKVVVASAKEFNAKHNYRKLVEVMVNNTERDITLLSRDLTRRTSNTQSSTRSGRAVA